MSRLGSPEAACVSRKRVSAVGAPVVDAIWLGYRASMPQEETQSYIESGTFHILSVSGVHMAMVFVTAQFLLRFFMRNPRKRALLISWSRRIHADGADSAQLPCDRPVMIAVYIMADLFDRDRDAVTALSLSAVVLLGWSPDVLFDTGFLLSFLSVASILIFLDGFSSLFSMLPRFLRGAFATSMAAADLRHAVGGCGRSTSCPWRGGGQPVCRAVTTRRPVVGFRTSVTSLSRPPWPCFRPRPVAGGRPHPLRGQDRVGGPDTPISPWSRRQWRPSCATGVARGPARRHSSPATTDMGGAAISLARWPVALWHPLFTRRAWSFSTWAMATRTVCPFRRGATLLVDGGECNHFVDEGQRTVAPFSLVPSGDTARLRGGLASDSDHPASPVHRRAFPCRPSPDGRHCDGSSARNAVFSTRASGRNVPVRRLHAGELLALGDLNGRSAPSASNLERRKERQQHVARPALYIGRGVRVLLPGDIENAAESVVAAMPCQAEILKAPHHGSKTSGSALFIESVAPGDVMVSTGGGSGHEPADDHGPPPL